MRLPQLFILISLLVIGGLALRTLTSGHAPGVRSSGVRASGVRASGVRASGVRASAAQASASPRLMLSTDDVDLGTLETGQEVRAAVDWHVTGYGPLRVLALRPDCRCAEASGLPAMLHGGERGRLHVRLKVPRRGGPLVARVRIVTTGPPGQDVRILRLSGLVAGDWQFEPAALDLGRWTPGRVATRTVALAGPAGITTKRPLRLLEPRLEGFAGRVHVLPPARAEPGAHARLRLEIRVPGRPGLHRGYLLVHVPEGEARLLPIRCTVVSGGPVPAGQQPLFPSSPAGPEQIQNARDVEVPVPEPGPARAPRR